MLKGEDIRKLSDVDLELYMLGVEEMEHERDALLKDKFTKDDLQQWCKLEDVNAHSSELFKARKKLWDYKVLMEQSLNLIIGGKFVDIDGEEWVIDAVRIPVCGDYVLFEHSPHKPSQCTNGSYPAIIYKTVNI